MTERLSKDFLEQALGPITPGQTYSSSGDQDQPDPAEVEMDVVLQALRKLNRVLGGMRKTTMGWGFDVLCPWDQDHTDRIDSGAFYVPILERFQCQHGHCADRQTGDARVKVDELLQEESMGLESLATLAFDDIPGAGMPLGGPTQKALASYEATEDGLALAFADRHANRLRFDHTRGRWFPWTGDRWLEDGTQCAFDWARGLMRDYRVSMPDLTPSQAKAWGKVGVAKAIELAARADYRLATEGRSWDQSPWLIGAPGCEINLKTGVIQAPDPEHLITKQVLVAPKVMPTPVWDQFLWDSTGGDPEVIVFLQAWSGYCLTGDTSEEKFVFFYGPGGNGKGTFLYTTSAIGGDYAVGTPADTFMVRRHAAHAEEIARLAGVRSVTAGEIAGGRTFNAARLKEFTGRDGKLSGRFMAQNTFEFTPQFKITFVGNNQPRLASVDDAMRRRLILVPFAQKPAIADPSLKDRLVPEYPGILQWMIEGENRRRARGGLAALIPNVALAATNAYLDNQDTLKTWLTERCVFGRKEKVGVTQAFEDYRLWSHHRGENVDIGVNEFSRKFLDNCPQVDREHTRTGNTLQGVGLSPQDDVI